MKSFNEIYEEIYRDNIQGLESIRKKKIKSAITIILSTIIGIIILTKLMISIGIESLVLVQMSLIILIFSIIVANKKTGRYSTIFKNKVIGPFVKNVDENLSYIPEKGIASALYRKCHFEHFDNYDSEDCIEGLFEGKYDLRIAEVHTENETTDSEGRRTTYTVFHGIFSNIKGIKDIGTTIRICSDKGFLGKLFNKKTRIEMDSSEFEEHFDVFTEDKIKTMQILTSDIMAMLVEFREQKKIRYEIIIENYEVSMRFHTGEVFEPMLLKSTLDYDMLKKYYDIIDFVFKVTREINKAIENTEI